MSFKEASKELKQSKLAVNHRPTKAISKQKCYDVIIQMISTLEYVARITGH